MGGKYKTNNYCGVIQIEMKDLVKQIAAKQNKAIKDAIQYRLNEGYHWMI